jgi:PAS domain S-box-containing protein
MAEGVGHAAGGPGEGAGGSGELRREAEALWRQAHDHQGRVPPADVLSLVHELEVHQIELELQNEELRRAQEELAAAHARYFELFDLAPVGYLTLNAEGLILEVNLAVAGLLGIERGGVAGQPLTRFIWSQDQDIYYLYRRRLAQTQGVEACELRLRGRAGVPVWVRLQSALVPEEAPAGDPNGGKRRGLRCRVTLTDISERKQAEEQVRFQAGLLQMVDEAVLVVDRDLKVIYWNRYAETLYGWPVEAALGHGLHELLAPRGTGKQSEAFEVSLSAGRSWAGNLEVKRKTGEFFSAFFTLSPIKDQQGEPVGTVTVSHDDTARHRGEEDLRLSREQLQNLSRRLVALQERERDYLSDRLINDESQRLAVLMIELGMLEHETQIGAATRDRIRASQALLNGVMHDLHDLAAYLRPATLDRLGLQAAISQYAEEFGVEHRLSIVCAFAGLQGKHPAREVETAVYRIVQQALSNVVQHADAGQVSVQIQARDGSVTAIVEDDGIGFDVKAALHRETPGLIEMRERAEALGGALHVESEPGHGTTIYAVLPIAGPNAATAG